MEQSKASFYICCVLFKQDCRGLPHRVTLTQRAESTARLTGTLAHMPHYKGEKLVYICSHIKHGTFFELLLALLHKGSFKKDVGLKDSLYKCGTETSEE